MNVPFVEMQGKASMSVEYVDVVEPRRSTKRPRWNASRSCVYPKRNFSSTSKISAVRSSLDHWVDYAGQAYWTVEEPMTRIIFTNVNAAAIQLGEGHDINHIIVRI
jgi:hypothetical protein